jgi:uncharacterized protein YjhX (UPF0386 family)
MSNCEDIFNQIRSLEAQRKGLLDQHTMLESVEGDPKPERTFLFRGKDGQEYEANFDEVWKRLARDPLAQQEWANAAAEAGYKPVGSEGQFENFRQMVDQMGMDNAQRLGAMLTAMTGEWERYRPADFDAVTSINHRDAFLERLSTAFTEARINIDKDALGQAISKNVAPFLGILNNQAKLEVFASLTRRNLIDAMDGLRVQMAETGVAPTREAKAQFLDSYAKAIYAHRAKRIASRRSGQLLQNYQRLVDEDQAAPGSLWEETGAEAKAQLDQLGEEVIAMTPQEMVKEGSLARRVVEATDKGAAGAKDMEELIQTIKTEGVDPIGDGDAGWESLWRRNARAAYKDSVLFSPRTQILSNYLSQKIVFLAEGFKRFSGDNAWRLTEGRARGAQLDLLGDDPEALAAARNQPVYVNPLGTDFFRGALKDQIDGARIAVEAGLRAEAAIKQGWGESIRKGFFEAEAPFAGNVDYFNTKEGQLNLDQQYQAAQAVLDEPLDPKRLPFQLRDKLHIALKLLDNSAIERATGRRLPVYSALQALTAVDQRAGLRAFMTDRANDLLLEQATLYPDRTLKEWGDAVDQQLQDQLYQAEPSPQNIKDARAQFGLEEDDLSDDEIAAWLAQERVGFPVLATAEQIKSKDVSIAMRMQQRQTQGLAGAVDRAFTGLRQSELGDTLVPFWQSPYNQTIWDISLANPLSPVTKIAQVAWNLPQGKVTPKMLGQAQAATVVWLSLAGMAMTMRSQGLIVGNGPLDPNLRKQWIQRLNAEGKVPNSIFRIPFNMGGIPVLNSLFLLVDAMDVIDQGNVSKYDQHNAFQGVLQVGAGAVMRMPGFRQVQMIYDTFANGNESAAIRMAAWVTNSQANVLSGGERFMEWATGTQATDLQAPRTRGSSQDLYEFDQLPENHPLKSTWNKVRSWVYNSNPGVSHWMGTRVKETTWLGRQLVRPDGIFRGEWPVGVPGIWSFNGGEYRVEQELERLGMLNPPTALMTGKLDRAYMTPGLEEEYNAALGTVKPQRPFSQDPRWGGIALWRGAEEQVSTYGNTVPVRKKLDLTRLIDQATQGRTVREAMNWVLTSKQWAKWEADPETTTNPKVRDMTAEMRKNQPGPVLIQRIKDYYADLAQGEIERSSTTDALQWKADMDRGVTDLGTFMQGQQQLLQGAN